MTDIVTRLRRYYQSNPEKENDLYRTIQEAADEIEQLTEILNTCRELREHDTAEIERLRNVEADHKQLLERLVLLVGPR